jgi:hypothetical protein
MEGVSRDETKIVGEFPGESELMLFKDSFRIYLDNFGPWFVSHENIELPFQVTDVMLCAL